MTINLQIPTKYDNLRPTITVVGVGGAGGNAVNNMISSNLEGVNFVVANTDAQALSNSLADRTIQLGASITKGLGAGANPEVGRASAEEAQDEILAQISGSNMVFITAGMGGGTGTGAAAVVARLAKEQGILTVAVVTKPFHFEGAQRMRFAEEGLKELQGSVDTLIVIPNQNLFRIANEKTTFADAFKMADEVLNSGVRGVTDLMVRPGLINLDFSDIRTVMREMGKAMMGTGEAKGERRAIDAAELAISNPLLDDVSLDGARALLVNVTGGLDMTLFEVDEALNRIREELDPEANIIFGSTFSDNMEGKMRVSVVATGIDAKDFSAPSGQKAAASSNDTATSAGAKKLFNPNAGGTAAAVPFNAVPRPEPIKAPPRAPHPESSRPQAEVRAAASVTRQERVERNADDVYAYESNMPESATLVRTVGVAAASSQSSGYSADVQEIAPRSVVRSAHPQPAPRQFVDFEQYEREVAPRGGLLRKLANVGRVFYGRGDSEPKPQPEPRVQVVQRSSVQSQDLQSRQAPSKVQDEDQYLDIPAFLRRQNNQ